MVQISIGLVVATFDPSIETLARITQSRIESHRECREARRAAIDRRNAVVSQGFEPSGVEVQAVSIATRGLNEATELAEHSKFALAERLSRSIGRECVVIAGSLAIAFDPSHANRIRSICPIADVEGLDAVNVDSESPSESESESPPVRAPSNLERVAVYADEIEFKAGRAFIISNASKREAIAECIAGCLFSVSQINERVCFEVHTHELLSV